MCMWSVIGYVANVLKCVAVLQMFKNSLNCLLASLSARSPIFLLLLFSHVFLIYIYYYFTLYNGYFHSYLQMSLLTLTYPPPIKVRSQRNSRVLSHSEAIQHICNAASHFNIKGYQPVNYKLMIGWFTFYFEPMILFKTNRRNQNQNVSQPQHSSIM